MKGLASYISEDLVLINIKAKDQFDCIEQMGSLLFQKGYVKDTYVTAAKEREKIYPTGLSTGGVGVAIPHTDAEHVLLPAVAICNLDKPVTFRLMGDEAQTVEVQLVFQLAISEPQEQLEMLQSLVELFFNEDLLVNLQKANDKEAIIHLIREELAKVVT